MILSREKIMIALARVCKSARDLRKEGIADTTIHRAMHGEPITTKVAGKIARALGVDVTEIMEDMQPEARR